MTEDNLRLILPGKNLRFLQADWEACSQWKDGEKFLENVVKKSWARERNCFRFLRQIELQKYPSKGNSTSI